jgi:hypothetical protein
MKYGTVYNLGIALTPPFKYLILGVLVEFVPHRFPLEVVLLSYKRLMRYWMDKPDYTSVTIFLKICNNIVVFLINLNHNFCGKEGVYDR